MGAAETEWGSRRSQGDESERNLVVTESRSPCRTTCHASRKEEELLQTHAGRRVGLCTDL